MRRLVIPLLMVVACNANGNGGAPDSANGKPDAGREAGPPDGPLPDSAPPPRCDHPKVEKSCKDDWCLVPAGCFWMGSPPTEKCREQCWGGTNCPKETRHPVTLTHGFEIKATEVTQQEFKDLMGYNPSYFGSGLTSPVEMVSWFEAAHYCNKVSANKGLVPCYVCGVEPGVEAGVPEAGVPDASPGPDGAAPDGGAVPDGGIPPDGGAPNKNIRCDVAPEFDGKGGKTIYDCPGYRLPTEAEWEYAYRAGTDTELHSGTLATCTGTTDKNADAIAWHGGNSGKKTHAVGGKTPNAWGVHDMSGNVWEWCHDRFQHDPGSDAATDPVGTFGPTRSDRGGSCWSELPYIRAAMRDTNQPNERYDYIGFRVVRTR
jgi:formylglycine-generating enzyme required for sulfatase activity